MSDIQASTTTIRDILRQSFKLGAYQREYEWESQEVAALMKDLLGTFRPRAGDPGTKGYFLGPVITTSRRDANQLIDGQQRLTSIALVIIALKQSIVARKKDRDDRFAGIFERRIRNIPNVANLFDDPARQRALNELERTGQIAEPETDLERNLQARYVQISEKITDELDDAEVPNFLEWILDNVSLAQIKAGESHDSFALFDAMNSRGRPLQGMAQFTSFLYRRFGEEHGQRSTAMGEFRETLDSIAHQGAGADLDFVQSWLASRCLDVHGATPARALEARRKLSQSAMKDIESKGPFFAMEHADDLPILGLRDPFQFVEQHWTIFGEAFEAVRLARHTFNRDLEGLYFLEQVKFDMGLYDEVLLLSSIKPGSDEWLPRVQVALQFLENIAARWAWTSGVRGLTPRSADRVKYLLAKAACEIRGKSLEDMARSLALLQHQLKFDFSDNKEISHPLRGSSPIIHALLARISAFLDDLSGTPNKFAEYAIRSGDGRYEVEHLLPTRASNASREHGHSFRRPDDYRKQRQRLGALTILPEWFNRELSAQFYPDKYRKYAANPVNLLTKSLIGSDSLPSKLQHALAPHQIIFPHAEILSREAITMRQRSLLQLAELIWSDERILQKAGVGSLARAA